METSTASRLSKSDEDIISQFSCGSSAKYQTSQIMIKDMIKLIRHLCPDMSKSNQAMALSLLEFNFRSKFSFKEISNKLAQLLKQKTPFFSLFTALLSLLESPKERAIRILNEFRSIASKQLLVKVDWLEASIYENSFNSPLSDNLNPSPLRSRNVSTESIGLMLALRRLSMKVTRWFRLSK